MSRPVRARFVPPAMAILTCRCCGLHYYLYTAIVGYVDTGYCVSCDNEIRWLEQYYGTDTGPSGEVAR